MSLAEYKLSSDEFAEFLNKANSDGKTFLHYISKDTPDAELLGYFWKGANFFIKDNDGVRPVDLLPNRLRRLVLTAIHNPGPVLLVGILSIESYKII